MRSNGGCVPRSTKWSEGSRTTRSRRSSAGGPRALLTHAELTDGEAELLARWTEADDASDDDSGIAFDADVATRQLGTVGGGNHFAEVSRVERVFDRSVARALGLRADAQAGSSIRARAPPARRSTPGTRRDALGRCGRRVPRGLRAVVRYARANRWLVAIRLFGRRASARPTRVSPRSSTSSTTTCRSSTGVSPPQGRRARAKEAPTVVLGSRGAPSFVMLGTGETSGLCSVAHGAGRRMSRGEADAKLRDRIRACFARAHRARRSRDRDDATAHVRRAPGRVQADRARDREPRSAALATPRRVARPARHGEAMIARRLTISSGSGPCRSTRVRRGARDALVASSRARWRRRARDPCHGDASSPHSIDLGRRAAMAIACTRSSGRTRSSRAASVARKRDRKRWYAGCHVARARARARCCSSIPRTVAIEACRAAGAGGQHVKKTASAVRAFDVTSGAFDPMRRRAVAAPEPCAHSRVSRRARRERSRRRPREREASRRRTCLAVERGRPVRRLDDARRRAREGGRRRCVMTWRK